MRFDRVAITGGGGRLGRYVADEIARHADVTVLDIEPGESPHRHTRVDVRDLAAVSRALEGHDAVIHLAAIDDGVAAPPEVYFETNVQGTWNVLHAAHQLGIARAAIASSIAATGIGRDGGSVKPRYLPVDEAHPLQPSGVYSLGKELDEAIARSFARRGVTRIACLRPTLIVRDAVAGQVDALARGVDYDASQLDEPFTEPLPLLRGYVQSRDAARAFRCALEVDTGPFDVFLVAARDSIGHVDTLAYARQTFGDAMPELRKPELYERDPCAGLIDITHARETLGWEPDGDWTTFVARAGR
ncbi:MAG: NAD-dependent epimerase/dehydratase family protein [Alphaproteobacteria bacterium]